jgi:dihydrofolate reductase
MSKLERPKVYLVAAVAANGVIGRAGGLPWRLPEDLKHFKRITLGHPLIMGRRTWESLRGALPQRENIVVTRTPGYEAPGAALASSLETALALCTGEPVAFVIGGHRLFAESLPLAAGLVMTEIHRDYEGDTRFPAYDRARWRETQRESHVAADGTKFDFVLYEPIASTRTLGSPAAESR